MQFTPKFKQTCAINNGYFPEKEVKKSFITWICKYLMHKIIDFLKINKKQKLFLLREKECKSAVHTFVIFKELEQLRNDQQALYLFSSIG